MVAEATRSRPPFNLRLRGDHALWADLQAVTHDVAEGTACSQALAEVENLICLSRVTHRSDMVAEAPDTGGTSASCKP